MLIKTCYQIYITIGIEMILRGLNSLYIFKKIKGKQQVTATSQQRVNRILNISGQITNII